MATPAQNTGRPAGNGNCPTAAAPNPPVGLPEHDDWIAALDREITATEGPIILIAHSLGTITVAEWASDHPSDKIIGALLVAIPDVQRPDLPDAIQALPTRNSARCLSPPSRF